MQVLEAVNARPRPHVDHDAPVAHELADVLGARGQVLLEVGRAQGLRHVACQAVDLLGDGEHERAVTPQAVVQDARRDVDAQHLVRPDHGHLLHRGGHGRYLVAGRAERLGPGAVDQDYGRGAHGSLEQFQAVPQHAHPGAAVQHSRRWIARHARAQAVREAVLFRAAVEAVHGDGQVHLG